METWLFGLYQDVLDIFQRKTMHCQMTLLYLMILKLNMFNLFLPMYQSTKVYTFKQFCCRPCRFDHITSKIFLFKVLQLSLHITSKSDQHIHCFSCICCFYQIIDVYSWDNSIYDLIDSCSDGLPSLLEHIVEAMCLHVSDESPTVRSLCLRGLVQVHFLFAWPPYPIVICRFFFPHPELFVICYSSATQCSCKYAILQFELFCLHFLFLHTSICLVYMV